MTNTLLERSMSSDQDDWPILSFSQMQMWDRCEYAWSLAYIEDWVSKETPAYSSIGTMIHHLFDMYYTNIRLGVKETNFVDEYIKLKINEAYEKDHSLLPAIDLVNRLVRRYINEFAPKEDRGHRILSGEYHFTVPMETGNGRHFILQGYIDLLTEVMGKIWIWDHKSSENNFWTSNEVMMDPQTPIYAVALRELGMKTYGYIINMINTYDYKKDPNSVAIEKIFKRESAYRTDKELNSVKQELLFMVDDMLENNPSPRRSLRRECGKRCGFREPCLMALKGMDPTPFLITKFRKKEAREVNVDFNPGHILEIN
jgi:hypothetical protein